MNMKPLVTAVITTYNRPIDVLERAIRSVLNQSYDNIELIIVNDCPQNKQLAEDIRLMVNGLQTNKKIEYIVQEKNGGACRARNTALRRANGEYFACLDDDDEWKKAKIEKQVRKAQGDDSISLVYCNSDIVNTYNNTCTLRFTKTQPEGDIYSELIGDNIVGSCTFPLMRVSSVRNVGGFDESFPALQDWDLYLRLLKEGRAGYVNDSLAVYYFHEGDRISAHPENRVMAYEKLLDALKDDLKKYKTSASRFFFKGCYFYELAKNYKNSFIFLLKGICNNPLAFKRNTLELAKLLYRLIVKPKIV